MEVTHERCSPHATCTDQEQGQYCNAKEWSIGMGRHPDHGQNDQGHPDGTSGDSKASTRHLLGDRPPEPTNRNGEAGKPKDEESEITDSEDDERHGEQQTATEGTQRQSALGSGDWSVTPSHRNRRRAHLRPP
jgi:hypothetical protein